MIPVLSRHWRSLLVATLYMAMVGADAKDKPVDLILVAGQSNAVGADTYPSDLPEDPNDKKVLFWWRCGDPPPDAHDSTSGGKEWSFLQVQPDGSPMEKDKMPRQYGNFKDDQGGFGPEMGLGRHLMKQQPERKLAIVKAAFSGTAIGKDWDPKDKTGDAGICYRALVSETKAALKAAEEDGVSMRIVALVWVQGESDSKAGEAEKYEGALREMIAALREDLSAPEMKALLAVNTKFGNGKRPLMPKIIESQKAVAASDPNCVYVDTSEATIANAAHYDTAGTLNVGKWFGEALLKMEAGGQ